MKVYIAGPMTGLPDFNYPAFGAAAERLRAEGWEVCSPTQIGQHHGWEWSDYMRAAIPLLLACDAIALLPGWERSRGARLEFHIAKALGYRVVDQ